MEALRRQISSNTYRGDRPLIVPIREDKRYRSWNTIEQPEANAVVIYMMDVSGSMTDEQKEIVRIESLLDRHLAARASTTASRRATSSTTRPPRRSTKTPSTTRAKAAARGSARPTRSAPI